MALLNVVLLDVLMLDPVALLTDELFIALLAPPVEVETRCCSMSRCSTS